MADTEQKDWQAETGDKGTAAGTAADEDTTATNDSTSAASATGSADSTDSTDSTDDETYGVPMDQVEAVLNATADKAALTPQMQRMMARQAENTKRVEETIKGTKSNPRWFVPLFCTLMIIGLIWAVCYYITSNYPIPGIGAWNLLIAFVIIMVGFIMTMWWR
ncbi:septation inhibitor protein [Bifidobacterium hapali]|uniref:Cell division protein CrgA n=1 Tax=Bifidobacterium hapali TaxID=1630172 RepID=A0A261G5G1_9BIFI|nr:cell division protein CrgA [Bifidobacterium hapali]OZG66652.1 septation inhibitor protein [Bifidobacterium hapali]